MPVTPAASFGQLKAEEFVSLTAVAQSLIVMLAILTMSLSV